MRDRLDKPFFTSVSAIGEARTPPIILSDESQVIRPQHTHTDIVSGESLTCTVKGVTGFQHLIDLVYPDLLHAKPTLFADQGMLAAAKLNIDEINGHILHLLPNPLHTLASSN